MHRKLFLFWILLLKIPAISYSQCVINNTITAPSSACRDQNISIETEDNGYQYQWDFCGGDFLQAPTFNSKFTGFPISSPFHMEVVHDGSIYRGFIANGAAKNILRLDFNNGLDQPPVTTTVSLINAPVFVDIRAIRLIRDGVNWFGLVTDLSQAKLFRLSFGNSLENNPMVEAFDFPSFDLALDLTVLKDGPDYFALVLNYGQNYISKIKFASAMSAVPALQTSVPIPGSNAVSISVKKVCTSWIGFVALNGSSSVGRIDFGNSIGLGSSATTLYSGYSGIRGISFEEEANGYHVFGSTADGKLYTFNFGFDPLADPISVSSANPLLSGTGTAWDIEMIKAESNWHLYFLDYAKSEINHFKFDTSCDATIMTSKEAKPGIISYASSGTKQVFVKITDGNGNRKLIGEDIAITSDVAPVADFTTSNVECVNTPITFNATVDTFIDQYTWSFGDTNSGAGANINHQYATNGTYTVALDVVASNMCANKTVKELKIFNPPTASFLLPTGSPLCTNQSLTFTNTSVSDVVSATTWQWYVNNIATSTSQDLNFSFVAEVNQIVKLRASIPGCFSESTQTVNALLAGPNLDFAIVGKCDEDFIKFDNLTTDAVNGFNWDFGDSKNSVAISPIHKYPTIGNYSVTLTGDSPNGCINSKVKPLTIYSKPQPNFSLDLPPFSCAGTPSQFNDLTPAPTDSNISNWNWSFGDPLNGTATTRNPTYVYPLAGTYDVSLTTTTNFGCSATKLKTIQIAESPKSNFTVGSSCLGKPTLFADASGTNNKSWLWKIGGTSYTIQNPTHVFSAPGNFTGELMVTGNNECVSSVSKPIIVYAPPVLDFLTENNCAPQATLFKDMTLANQDRAVSRLWDFAGKGTGTGSTTQFAFSSPGTYNVKLTTSTQSGCSYSLTKSTIIVAAPIADFSTSSETGPPPLEIQFNNKSKNATLYQWKFNDSNNSSSSLESPAFTYTTLGDFMVVLKASNIQGCVDTKSEKIHVIVPSSEVELEQFTLLYDQVNGSVRPVLSIRNNSNYTIKSLEVILDIAGNALVKERINLTVLPNATASQILKYELLPRNTKLDYLCVKLQLSDDRLSDETDLTDNSECISIESNEILFSPYPNPVTDQLNFDWIAEAPGSVKVSVVTQMGQLAYQKDISGVEVGLNQILLDVSNLNSGFYMLIFESAGSRKTFPFVIVN